MKPSPKKPTTEQRLSKLEKLEQGRTRSKAWLAICAMVLGGSGIVGWYKAYQLTPREAEQLDIDNRVRAQEAVIGSIQRSIAAAQQLPEAKRLVEQLVLEQLEREETFRDSLKSLARALRMLDQSARSASPNVADAAGRAAEEARVVVSESEQQSKDLQDQLKRVRRPTASDDLLFSEWQERVTVMVGQNDISMSASGGVLQIVQAPQHGSAMVDGLTITYSPENGFVGRDTIRYAMHDEFGSDEATVMIEITPPDGGGSRRPR